MFFVETETLLHGLLWGRAGYYWIRFGEDWITILDYMHSGPTGATYLPDLYRLPYPVEDLGP